MLLNSWEQIEALGDDTRVAIIELCLRPQTVSDLAATLGVPRTRLYHHVNRLTELGLQRYASLERPTKWDSDTGAEDVSRLLTDRKKPNGR